MFLTLLFLTILSLTLSLLLTPTIRTLAIRWNLVDLPDNKRKVHKTPIPRVGGVAVAAAYFGSLLAVGAWLAFQRPDLGSGFAAIKSIAPAAIVIFLIGLADDIFNLKPSHKFGLQIIAAAMVVSAGVHIHGIGAFDMYPVLGAAATIVWLVACTNAVNLIDGLDGLAAGIAFLATLTTLVASLISGNVGLTIATAPLAAALLGFLVFNFNPASIFLGDSGSLLLGFLLGCNSILSSESSGASLAMCAPLMTLAVPLLDTTLAIARRFLRGQPIFGADRSHIHHRLLARGISHRTTVLLLYVAATVAGMLSLCLICAHGHWDLVVLAAFASAVILGIRTLGYSEFEALRTVVFQGGIRQQITAQLAIETFEQGLEAAETASDCWAVIQGGSKEFGLHAPRMQFGGHLFYSHGDSGSRRTRAMRIPILESDWIEVSHDLPPAGYSTAIVPFANVIQRVMTDKRSQGTEVAEEATIFSSALFSSTASTVN